MKLKLDEAFQMRLKTALGNESIRSFADRAGVSHASMAGYLRGENDPTRSMMNKIALASGINIAWLMTGEGPMRPGEAMPTPEPAAAHSPGDRMATDRELMGRCFDAIGKLYQSLNIKMPLSTMGEEAADLHDDVLASGATSLDEYLVAIRFAIAQRRKALLAAPPSSKHQDSA